MPSSAQSKHPKRVRLASGIAAIIQKEFGVVCNRNIIAVWRKRYPDMPTPDAVRGEFEVEPFLEWAKAKVPCIKARLNGHTNNDEELAQADLLYQESEQAKSKQQIIAAKRAAFKFEQEQGEWIKLNEAEGAMRAVVKQSLSFVQEEIEDYGPMKRKEMLQQLGVNEEIIAKFLELDIFNCRAVSQKITGRYKDGFKDE